MKIGHSEERYYDPNWQRPDVVYGNDLIGSIARPGERFAVVTMEIPWNLVKDSLTAKPDAVVLVKNMELEALQSLEKTIPPVDAVAGIGGGSSHDLAKYIALKKKARLVQVPSILSADAVVTDSIGIREEGKVRYIGHVVADQILVDFSLIKKAPKELVRYGAGDILSSHTAIYDWKLASSRGKAEFNQTYYDKANYLISTLKRKRFEIRDATDDGIRTIIDLYLAFAEIANKLQSDRAQEGSEHFFAYNVEHITRKQYVHGKLLAIGIAVMSYVQNNGFEDILALSKDLGMESRLETVELGREDFFSTMMTLKRFVQEGGYYYSAIDETQLDRYTIEKLYSTLSSK